MAPKSEQFKIVAASIIAALTILTTAWWTKGTENENAWLWVFVIWCVVYAGYEVYSRKK